MTSPPYDLKQGDSSSDGFYDRLSSFSRQVMDRLHRQAGLLLGKYAGFVQRELGERPRSLGEYGIEYLTLGMVLRRYGGASQQTSRLTVGTLRMLYRWRARWPGLKIAVDPLRGMLAGALLVPRIGVPGNGRPPDAAALRRLIRWLDATGEFHQELKRLNRWNKFLDTLPPEVQRETLETSVLSLEDFQERAAGVLGAYTSGVSPFLRNEYHKRGWREDQVFCGKEELEYHLNMVASEIMNWGLREGFLGTPRRAVLVPGCMRRLPEKRCRARREGTDISCAGCDPACHVNRVRRLGEEHGFEVFLVPHSTSFSRWLKRWQGTTEYGVVAVACALNIAVGGYEMRDLEIPSQCVLLDCPGCKKHWHPQGISTDLNDGQLLRVLRNG